MYKKWIFWSIILLVSTASAQKTTTNDLIAWQEDYRLKYNDFKGRPPGKAERGQKVAVTSSVVSLKTSSMDKNIPDFEVFNYFEKKGSWIISKTEDVLIHEQLHFDISEIFARKIRRELKKLQEHNERDTDKYYQVFDKLLNELNDYQNQYDSEVYFNVEKQKDWIDKVANELKALEAFK
jgi:hypothetical protein